MRDLSPEERALWDKVAATIRPLSREPVAPVPSAPPAAPPVAAKRAVVPRSPSTANRPAPPPPVKGIGTTLDGSWDKRLRRGEVRPDRILDLHGHTLDRAWEAIDATLERAIAAGDRVVLLITGHRRTGAPPVERGRIRAAVDDWLHASRHASRIAAVRGAHPRHGGGGSLYLILRNR